MKEEWKHFLLNQGEKEESEVPLNEKGSGSVQSSKGRLEVLPEYLPYMNLPETKITIEGPFFFPVLERILTSNSSPSSFQKMKGTESPSSSPFNSTGSLRTFIDFGTLDGHQDNKSKNQQRMDTDQVDRDTLSNKTISLCKNLPLATCATTPCFSSSEKSAFLSSERVEGECVTTARTENKDTNEAPCYTIGKKEERRERIDEERREEEERNGRGEGKIDGEKGRPCANGVNETSQVVSPTSSPPPSTSFISLSLNEVSGTVNSISQRPSDCSILEEQTMTELVKNERKVETLNGKERKSEQEKGERIVQKVMQVPSITLRDYDCEEKEEEAKEEEKEQDDKKEYDSSNHDDEDKEKLAQVGVGMKNDDDNKDTSSPSPSSCVGGITMVERMETDEGSIEECNEMEVDEGQQIEENDGAKETEGVRNSCEQRTSASGDSVRWIADSTDPTCYTTSDGNNTKEDNCKGIKREEKESEREEKESERKEKESERRTGESEAGEKSPCINETFNDHSVLQVDGTEINNNQHSYTIECDGKKKEKCECTRRIEGQSCRKDINNKCSNEEAMDGKAVERKEGEQEKGKKNDREKGKRNEQEKGKKNESESTERKEEGSHYYSMDCDHDEGESSSEKKSSEQRPGRRREGRRGKKNNYFIRRIID